MQKSLSIGRLAATCGVNVETIRYYQRIGIISEPEKPAQGFRQYPASDIDRILFIKRAQALGFSLQEINELLALNESCCEDVRERAIEKRDHIEAQIKDLQQLRSSLDDLIDACCRNSKSDGCPIITALKT